MSNPKVVLLDEFNAGSLAVGKVKDNRNGPGKSANLSYDTSRFFIALKNVRFPFGASAKPAEFRKGSKEQYTLQCELTSEQIDKIKQIEAHLLDNCLENKEVLTALNIKKSRDVLESKFTSCLKYSKDKTDKSKSSQYPPTIRISIPNDNGDGFNCNFYKDNNGSSEKVDVNNIDGSEQNIKNFLTNGSIGSVLISTSLWFTTAGFGMILRATQLKATPRQSYKMDMCLLDQFDSSCGQQQQQQQVEDPDLEEELNEDAKSEQLEEEVEEEEEEPSPEPIPEPPKKPSTKRSNKK